MISCGIRVTLYSGVGQIDEFSISPFSRDRDKLKLYIGEFESKQRSYDRPHVVKVLIQKLHKRAEDEVQKLLRRETSER